MRVRALKSFSAYVGSQIVPVASGEEIEGDLALALVAACCAVEIVDDPQGALAAAAEFHAEPPAAAEPVTDTDQVGDSPAPDPVEEPPAAPALVATKVRARSDFSAYDGANVVQFVAGQEVEGDLAGMLADADCDVEVLETEARVADDDPGTPPTPPVDPAPAPDGPAGGEAPEPLPADPDYTPGPHKVAEVLAYVEQHPEQATAILAAERADRARTTLLEGLADFIAARA